MNLSKIIIIRVQTNQYNIILMKYLKFLRKINYCKIYSKLETTVSLINKLKVFSFIRFFFLRYTTF